MNAEKIKIPVEIENYEEAIKLAEKLDEKMKEVRTLASELASFLGDLQTFNVNR